MKRLFAYLCLGTALITGAAAGPLVFVANDGTNSIVRFDYETGEYLGMIGNGFFTGNVVNGVAVGPDGYLHTVVAGTGARIMRFQPYTGEFAGSYATSGFLSSPDGIAFGPDGLAYVGDAGTGSIKRFDPATGEFRGSFASGFLSGGSVVMAFSSDGKLHVTNGSSLMRFEPVSGEYLGTYANGFIPSGTRSLSFDANGRILATGNFASQVFRFDPVTGEYLGTFANGFINSVPSTVTTPDGLVLVNTSTVGGTIPGAQTVMRFDSLTGEYLGHFGYGFLSAGYGMAVERPMPVTGTVTLSDGIIATGKPATFTVKDLSGNVLDVQNVTLGAGGTYSFTTLARGSVRILCKVTHWLAKGANNTIAFNGLVAQNFNLDINGDCDPDNVIDLSDYLTLAAAFDGVAPLPPYNPMADLDENGTVDLTDYLMLAANFDAVGDN